MEGWDDNLGDLRLLGKHFWMQHLCMYFSMWFIQRDRMGKCISPEGCKEIWSRWDPTQKGFILFNIMNTLRIKVFRWDRNSHWFHWDPYTRSYIWNKGGTSKCGDALSTLSFSKNF